MAAGTVVIFLPTFNVGGVEKNAVFAASALAERGFATHFVYARATGPQFALLDARVVRHQIEPLFASRHLNQHTTDALSCLPQTVRYLRRLKKSGPVAVLSFQSNLTALLAAKLAGVRVLVRLSNHASAVTIGGGLTPRVSHVLKCLFYRFADRVIANSEENAVCYRELLKREVGVVYTPSSDWLPEGGREPLHPWLAEKTLPVVVGAGRFAREKDFSTLLRAFALAVQTLPARLVIFGEGRLRPQLEAEVRSLGLEECVSLPGYSQDCGRQIAQAELFVLSSLYEGLPNVLVEAVCAGVPCVSTRCHSGPAEILLNGAGGDLVAPQDAPALAEAIVRNLSDRAYAAARRDAARAASDRFQPERIAGVYAEVVSGMLAGTARGGCGACGAGRGGACGCEEAGLQPDEALAGGAGGQTGGAAGQGPACAVAAGSGGSRGGVGPGRRPAKLVFLHPYFHNGGAEKSILRLAEVALARGYACDIVTIRPSAVFSGEVARIGVGFVDLGAARLLAALPAWLRYLRAQQAAGYRLIVIANQSYVNIFAVLFRWLYPARTRLLLSERHHFDDYRLTGGWFKARLIPLLMRLTYRYADQVTANSTGLAHDVQALTGTPCACLFNPTFDGRILSLAQQPVAHRWFDGNHRVILAAGRLEKVKGFPVLLDAFARLAAEFPAARLLILGEGALREELQARIDAAGLRERVDLAGFQANPYPFMARSELFVLSSYHEGLPNTLIEAILCGCPALSTDCPSGPADILLGGLGGDLVPVADVPALAAAMRNALADPERARRLHGVAREGCARFEQQAAGAAFLRVADPLAGDGLRGPAGVRNAEGKGRE